MKILAPVSACSALLLLASIMPLAMAAPDPFEKLELRAALKSDGIEIQALAFSPDGKILASTGRDGTVRLWDTVNGKCLRILKGHGTDPPKEGPVDVTAVVFSPDGTTVASSGSDMTIRLWDVSTGECTVNLQGFVSSLLFSSDGKSLVIEGYYLLDLKTQKKRSILDDSMLRQRTGSTMAFYDPKGQLLVACVVSVPKAEASASIVLWDSSAGKKTFTLTGHTKAIMKIAFSRDGTLLASADLGKTIRLWDVATGKNIATFEDQPDLSHALAFSPDGKVLACGGRPSSDTNREAGKVRLLRVSDGKLLATLDGYTRPIGHLVFSPKGQLLATGGSEPTIKLWNIPSELPGDKDK